MTRIDPQTKRARDEADDWLNRFPLLREEEHGALVEWLRASPDHMRARAAVHVFNEQVDDLCQSHAATVDDQGLEELVRGAREQLASERAAGRLKEEDLADDTVRVVSRGELLDDAGEWLMVLTNPTPAERKAFDAWLATSTDHAEILTWARQAWARIPERCTRREASPLEWRLHYHNALRALRSESVEDLLNLCWDSYPGGPAALWDAVRAETGVAFSARSLDIHTASHEQGANSDGFGDDPGTN